MTQPPAGGRDGFVAEVLLLVAVLVGGAVLRFGLSTALPFDVREMELLAGATDPSRGLRVPFIMLNGASLFALYILVRRSAGVPAAFAALLLLQTSLTFQEAALRIRLTPVGVLPALVALTAWRLTRPPWRARGPVSRALLAVAGLLALKGVVVAVGVPGRMESARAESHADAESLRAALLSCGLGPAVPVEELRRCDLPWPERRSLDQQEDLLDHLRLLGPGAEALLGPPAAPARGRVAVLDEAAAAFLVVDPGDVAKARRVARVDASGP